MSPNDRELLTRFYLEEQSQERVCEQMNLTATQFRLLKNRAKARLLIAVQEKHSCPSTAGRRMAALLNRFEAILR
jgi:hypothetical protein